MEQYKKKRSIAIFNQFDPRGDRVGGIGKYILSFITNAPSDITFQIIGVTKDRSELFKWERINISGKYVDFYPVCVVRNENIKGYLPVTLKYVYGVFRARFKTQFSRILFMQRLEYAIPLSGHNYKKYLVLHNDLERQLCSGDSEVLWAKFPYVFKFFLHLLLPKFSHIYSVNSNTISFVESLLPNLKNNISFSPTWAEKKLFFNVKEEIKLDWRTAIGQKHNIEDFNYWLIFVGRFQKQKNIELLVEALGMLSGDVALLLAGTGEDYEKIESMIMALNLSHRSVFLGNVPHHELQKYLSASDAYVSTSYFEGMSVALLEALQCGTPVITTPTGESKRIVINGINGIVTNGWEVDEFVAAVNSVLSFRGDVEKQCIESVSKYSAHSVIPAILDKMDL
ncbi:MAG: glycosyltransferase [Candidatus Scalindua sp.]